MGMCKQCGEVYASVDIKDGVCLTCRPDEGSIKTNNTVSIKEDPTIIVEDKITQNIDKNVIFCKECGAKNDIDSVQCKKCGSMLQVANTPLSGEERLKIVGFFAFLVLPYFWFGGTVIIVVIIIGSLYIMIKDKNFSAILKSRKYIKYYLLFLVYAFAIVIIGTIINNLLIGKLSVVEAFSIITGVSIVGYFIAKPISYPFLKLFDYLYFDILKKHQKWILDNGILADVPKSKDDNSIDIIERDKLSSFSIADELMKWHDMLDKGLVTQEEFDKAKRQLLNEGDS